MSTQKELPSPSPSLIEEKLFKDRSVFVFGEITQEVAQQTSQKLIALAHESDATIKMFVNSPGGHVESGDTIHDLMRFISPTVQVIGTGWVASAGVLIFLGAEKENRFCLPNTRFLIHQPSGGARGPAVDIEIQAIEILRMKERLNKLIAERTGMKLEKVTRDSERDFWMSAQEAKDYGIVTHIIQSVDQLR